MLPNPSTTKSIACKHVSHIKAHLTCAIEFKASNAVDAGEPDKPCFGFTIAHNDSSGFDFQPCAPVWNTRFPV